MSMSVDKQYSVFLVNKPGNLAKVTQALGDAKINIKALTLVDSQEHGVLRLVVENTAKADPVLHSLNLPVTETDVLSVELPNYPGSLADVCNRLAEKHVNINYAYLTTGARNGKALGVFKVSDINKAKKILTVRKPMRKAAEPVKKRPARR
ncbi:MAG: hypothetical protein GX629_13070 [Phycisphaerae bacterium]|jgi:hypothetical protein|nr:hypothetical protein [Phycisphaerae bacterium]